jgi:hypothetical protein
MLAACRAQQTARHEKEQVGAGLTPGKQLSVAAILAGLTDATHVDTVSCTGGRVSGAMEASTSYALLFLLLLL